MWCPFVKDQSCNPLECALGMDGSCALARIVQELRFLNEDLETIRMSIPTMRSRSNDRDDPVYASNKRDESIRRIDQWIEQKSISETYLLNTPMVEIYRAFCMWNEDTDGEKPLGRTVFYTIVRDIFGFAERARFDEDYRRYFMVEVD